MRAALVTAVCLALETSSVRAFEPMSGCFVAEQTCEAGRSVRNPDNPGQLRLEVGHPYRLLGANKRAASHFQVVVPGADPDQRWVDARCGRVVEDCGTGIESAGSGPVAPPSHAQNLLAVSWQPAFCESHRRKPECDGQTVALAFTLHGLWPQPDTLAYCDVDATEAAIDRRGRWDLLPAIEVDEATRAALDQAMPGAQSMLDRHEWIKHGTCYSRTAEEYFDEALRLLAELNASAVRELVVSRIGRTVRLDEVRASFDSAFGQGAGRRVAMDCDRAGRRTLVTGLNLNLSGEITADTGLADLLAMAPVAAGSCREGVVDQPG